MSRRAERAIGPPSEHSRNSDRVSGNNYISVAALSVQRFAAESPHDDKTTKRLTGRDEIIQPIEAGISNRIPNRLDEDRRWDFLAATRPYISLPRSKAFPAISD
jgi:hypothetical protein